MCFGAYNFTKIYTKVKTVSLFDLSFYFCVNIILKNVKTCRVTNRFLSYLAFPFFEILLDCIYGEFQTSHEVINATDIQNEIREQYQNK